MERKIDHSLLKNAKFNKNDEFFTQLVDIESELIHYSKSFKGKVVFCNCDDPRISNFFLYFYLNFRRLGIKKLIAACYRPRNQDLFDVEIEKKGFYYEYSGELGSNCFPDSSNIIRFQGDGDFRSPESVALLEEADIVVTNPPFSLFRDFIGQLIRFNKKFLIIGNINAITYKDIFRLIKENKIWLGVNLGRGVSGFIVPKHYKLYGTETKIDISGNRIISPNNCLWLTNLKTPKRSEKIVLTKSYFGNEGAYPRYDNYDGININKTKDIPKDFPGHMGVPITFLHKFNPEQFEIIKFRKGDDGKDLSVGGKTPYFRILVRNKCV